MLSRIMTRSFTPGLAMVLFATAAHADDKAKTVEAEGYAAIYGGDKVAARDKALDDALRRAVEQSVGTFVNAQTETENFMLISDKITTEAKGFVTDYKIVNEGVKENEMVVKVAATVKSGDIKAKVDEARALIERKGRPRIVVIIPEQAIEKNEGSFSATSVGTVENTLMEYFMKRGFSFVDRGVLEGKISQENAMSVVSDQAKLMEFTKLTDAQIVIFGSAVAKNAGPIMNTKMTSGQANISLRVVKTDNGELIASASSQEAFPHIEVTTAGIKALQKATAKISEKLLKDILKKWIFETGGTQRVAVKVKGIKFKDLQSFKNFLSEQVRGVKTVNQRKFEGDVAEFDIELQGSADAFASEISDKKFGKLTSEVTAMTGNTINLTMSQGK